MGEWTFSRNLQYIVFDQNIGYGINSLDKSDDYSYFIFDLNIKYEHNNLMLYREVIYDASFQNKMCLKIKK